MGGVSVTQTSVKVKVKRLHKDAVIPRYATSGSAAVDLHSTVSGTLLPRERAIIPTGISVQIPEGHVGLIFPRSGNAANHGITLTNAVAVIDSDYRGEVKVLLVNHGFRPFEINVGDRIAQMMILPYPTVEFVDTDELTDTERGSGGFGSTGV
jgi:dUTP pyrophosphatase